MTVMLTLSCLMIFFAYSFTLTSAVQQAADGIVLTQILYRHGDRAPYGTFPTNPVPPSAWPDGYEQLTEKGIQQHYELGKYFRQRYILGKPYQLLNETYSRTEIVLESTDVDRTLMSAYSNLAGFYPPTGRQQWSKDVLWQPIPVHTKPTVDDHMLYMETECPAYNVYFNNVLNSEEVRSVESKNQEFYRHVENRTGLEHINVTNVWRLHDILLCQKCHGYELPSWANATWKDEGRTVYNKLEDLSAYSFDLQFNRFGEKRLKGGVLLKKMLDNMKLKITGAQQTPKAYIYSAHDDTIVALLSSMNAFNGISPPYASTVIVELHRTVGTGSLAADYTVSIFYRNDSTAEPYPIHVSGCDVKRCTLNKLEQLLQDNIPLDWYRECNPLILYVPGTGMAGVILLPLLCISVMLFTVVAFMAGVRKKSERRYDSLNSDLESAILKS